jgi:hypothetical protein
VLSLFIVTCRLGIYEISRMNGVSQVINMAGCQNSGTLQPHEHGCVMHDTRNILDLTTTKN